MTFDIVIPTFQRKEKLIRLLMSIPRQENINTWVYFDNNDSTRNEIALSPFFEIASLYCTEKYQAFGIWNSHLGSRLFNSDIMVYICDDAEFYYDTLINVENIFNKKFPDTDGVVTFKQANMQGTDSAMGCIGKKFAERYPNNQVFNPNYVSFYADTDVGDYAKKLGKFHYGTDCLINHYHPGSFKDELDKTHNIIRGKDKTIDIQINKIRKEKELLYPETLEMIDRSQYE